MTKLAIRAATGAGAPAEAAPSPRARSRAGETADRIKELILTDGLQTGDLLPTEFELCERLEVSRSSIREAVRTLSTLDIVVVRRGHGTYVGRMSLDALVETLVFRGILSPGDDVRALRDVVEVRQALDQGLAERVVASLTGTPHPELHELVAQMVELASRGRTFPQHDRAFHTGLLAGLDNPLVGQLVTAFWDVHTTVVPKLGLSVASDLEQTARAHGLMLEAAERGDVTAFRTAIAAHYAPIERALEATTA